MDNGNCSRFLPRLHPRSLERCEEGYQHAWAAPAEEAAAEAAAKGLPLPRRLPWKLNLWNLYDTRPVWRRCCCERPMRPPPPSSMPRLLRLRRPPPPPRLLLIRPMLRPTLRSKPPRNKSPILNLSAGVLTKHPAFVRPTRSSFNPTRWAGSASTASAPNYTAAPGLLLDKVAFSCYGLYGAEALGRYELFCKRCWGMPLVALLGWGVLVGLMVAAHLWSWRMEYTLWSSVLEWLLLVVACLVLILWLRMVGWLLVRTVQGVMRRMWWHMWLAAGAAPC